MDEAYGNNFSPNKIKSDRHFVDQNFYGPSAD
jgi:hypothetical protein